MQLNTAVDLKAFDHTTTGDRLSLTNALDVSALLLHIQQ
jgi:hypothetical protein